jgi:hypothetical protein
MISQSSSSRVAVRLCHTGRDAGAEQGRRHEPPLDLRIPGIHVDAEFSGVATS